MRICMIAYTHYATDSRVRREAEALASRGDLVDVVSLRKPREETIRKLVGVRVLQIWPGRYRGSSSVMYLASYAGFFVIASICTAVLHLRHRYQIVQVHTMPDFIVFAAVIPKILGAKIVLDVHDLMPELYQSKFGLDERHWLIRLIRWSERQSVRFAHKAIAVNETHLQTLIGHGTPGDKFTIVLNLPDPGLFSGSDTARNGGHRGFRVMYHGTIAARHGLAVAMHAVAVVSREIKDLTFQIVGEGDAIPELTELVNELNLMDCVEFKGAVALEKLAPLILEADIGVVPLLCDEFTRNMLPVKLLEYVALGLPVVCSKTETIAAYFDDSMLQYFAPGDADGLAEGILALYRSPTRRNQLAENARQFNREHNWATEKLNYCHLIDQLANEA